MEDKAKNAVTGLLGIARRAGRLSIGFDAVCAQIGEGKAELVLLACDLSEKTGKELRYAARDRKLSAIRPRARPEKAGGCAGADRQGICGCRPQTMPR